MARDINDIQRDIERTRRQLASTLDELADRSKPKNLVDDAKGAATEKLQDRNVQMALAGVGAAVVGLVALAVFRSNRRKNDIKELQRLLAERRYFDAAFLPPHRRPLPLPRAVRQRSFLRALH